MVISISEELARYQQLRTVQKTLHSILMKRLPRHAIEEAGKRLGIYRGGGLAFNSMDETSVLLDYCIYDYRWDGCNVIERYVGELHIDTGSDEEILLDAMLKARFSLFAIDEVVRGVGVQTRDLMRGDVGFIMDIAMSETAMKGLILASRIISPERLVFSMTTGAGLPADRSIMERVVQEIPERFSQTGGEIVRMSPETAAEFSASVIRIFLEGDASSRMAYEGPDRDAVGAQPFDTSPKVGRNDPCPCESGKKYKKCCGKAT